MQNEFLKYYPYAVRAAKILTNNSALAEDLVQDLFLKIHKNKITIDGEKNYKGYLNTAIRHRYFSYLKNKKLHKNKGLKVPVEKAFNVAEETTDNLLSDELLKAIGSIKEKYSLPFILNVVQEYTYEEIAIIMNIPTGTVKSSIFRARKELKQKITA
jgi:RNA polymerase sigma-70 factor (ECF subfamily)